MSLQIQKVEGVESLKPDVANDLKKYFNPLFDQAKEWEGKSKDIVVSSVDDVEMMQKAREARLMLKKIRVDTEKIRKELKEESLLKGKAIDGIANVIKYLVIPIESRLEEQEKFVEIQEQRRLDNLAVERSAELMKLEVDCSLYDLREMQEETYQTLLESSKIVFDKRQEDLRKEEESRIERERKEREEQERIRKENEKLKAEAKEREEKLTKEQKEREAKEAKERAEREEKEVKEREAYEAKMQKEREAREKAEKELQDKREAELKAQKEAEEKKKAEEKAKKDLALAPDKEKLRVLANELLDIDLPKLQTEEGKKILEDVKILMKKVNVYIVENIDRL